jgi:dTDP-4-amino-4,6-dideoxygalactose transaminase
MDNHGASEKTARSQETVPFTRPSAVGRELEYVAEAARSGHLGGNGPFARRCEQLLAERTGAMAVLLTPSCTAALELAARLLDVGPQDEVIMPSFTYVSTANAVVLAGATPVFVDIRDDTLNLDESLVAKAITPRTKAILPVHYAGVGCAMDKLCSLAKARGLAVIEDAAHGVNARFGGKHLGTFGDVGCYSFHDTKNHTAGEAGALLVNRADLIPRAEVMRDKGTDRGRFVRGEIDRYTWVDLGSSHVTSELVAAFLLGQLEAMDRIDTRRRALYERYQHGLRPLEEAGLLRLPRVPPECAHNAHLFFVLLNDEGARDALALHLRGRGIRAVRHYVPLHGSPQGRRVARTVGSMAVTDALSARQLRLPMFYGLTAEQQDRVIEGVTSFFGR